jgi:succinoglycan biosynthesis transport protein ExoP
MSSVRKTSSSRSPSDKEASPISFDYDHISRLCVLHWKWLTGAIVLGALIGFVYAAVQTPVYAAKASIVVQAKNENAPSATDRTDVTSNDMLKTFEQLLQTKALPEGVVRSEHLNENADFLPPGVTPPVSEDTATDMLAGMISIHIRGVTRLIDITVNNRSPEMAAFLANKLASEAILQEFHRGGEGATVLSDYLEKEVDRLQEQVTESEHDLQAYREAHKNAVSMDPDEDVNALRMKDLNQQYINAQALVDLLKERYGPNHPKLIEAENTAEELRNEVNDLESQAAAHSDESNVLMEKESVAKSYALQLDSMRQEQLKAVGSSHVEIPGISIGDPAEVPGAPVFPDKKKCVAIGAMAGLLCSVVFIFGLYFVDSSVRTVSQAESTLGVNVVAAIPILSETEGKSGLPTFTDPQSFVAESFRGLRATLILHDRERLLKTILVASAVPGEGKSFCGANLAVAFAQAGLKTLLIDADLRLPTVHTYFDLPGGGVNNGFTETLAGRANLTSAILPATIPNLSLLLTSIPAESPAELLSGPRLGVLLDEAAASFDRIVIDSAPLNAVSDTMLIMQKTDAILLVVRASQTPASECKAALEKIYSSKMKPLGLILNYLAPHSLKSYAYGYSYGQKPKEKNAK